jgi:hypothetical protein
MANVLLGFLSVDLRLSLIVAEAVALKNKGVDFLTLPPGGTTTKDDPAATNNDNNTSLNIMAV